jgi:hypothetical protein
MAKNQLPPEENDFLWFGACYDQIQSVSPSSDQGERRGAMRFLTFQPGVVAR